MLTAANSRPLPLAPAIARPLVTWKFVSIRRPFTTQSSWGEWAKIVPLWKMNAPGSLTMLQVPPSES
jgi:hypothetical protein